MAYSIGRIAERNNRGQTSVELTVALVMVAMLLLASVRIFLWLNAKIVNQQSDYDDTRVAAGAGPLVNGVDLSALQGVEVPHVGQAETLNLFR